GGALPKLDSKLDSKLDAKADEKDKPRAEQTVRSLLTAVATLRAEDFEPVGSPVTVDEKKPLLRIEVEVETGGRAAKKDKAATTKEVLLIGDKVRDKDQYYARLGGDTSVVRVDSKQLEPVFALVKDPRPLRSRDVAQFDADEVDAVEIQRGKEFVKLFRRDLGWRVVSSDTEPRGANPGAIMESNGLLAAIQGRHEIDEKDFEDPATPEDVKKLDAKFAPEKLEAKVIVWTDSLQAPSEKKDEKKDDKKAD